MTLAELSRIDRSIEIKVSPERLWRALTSATELSAWFQVTIEGEIAPGNEVWMTSVHPQHTGQRFRVRFVEMNAAAALRLAVASGRGGSECGLLTRAPNNCDVHAGALRSGTRLRVQETGFDAISLARRAKVYGDNSQGWTEVLGWLQCYVEAAS